MRKAVIGLFLISVFAVLNPRHAWAGVACDRVGRYFMVLSDAARIDPQGAEQVMGRTRDHYLAMAYQAFNGGMEDSRCRQFIAGVQQNWDMNIREIFPKLKRSPRPSGASQVACGRAFAIVVNFTLKEKSPNIFGVYVWAANTALVSPVDCQWIVNAYS